MYAIVAGKDSKGSYWQILAPGGYFVNDHKYRDKTKAERHLMLINIYGLHQNN